MAQFVYVSDVEKFTGLRNDEPRRENERKHASLA